MIKIRAATLDDSESIAAIYEAATGSMSTKHTWSLPIANGHLVVAEMDDRLAGFGGIDFESTTPLKWLYVVPKIQRTGVGSALLQKLELTAKSGGLDSLRLHAAPDARQFYLRHGYSDVPIEERHAHDHEGVEMIKRLS